MNPLFSKMEPKEKDMLITIPGIPIAKKRPRFARRGKFVVTYSEQQTEEGRVLLFIREQWKQPLIDGPVRIKAEFVMPIPKCASNKQKERINAGLIPHIKRPDLDNLIKFLKDCMNQTVWKDDSQVVWMEALKRYGEEPKTIVSVEDVMERLR